ncbi:MAG: amino acid adenylation domain-containing protein, partial [Gemmatimonadetes bacterium]|nr:amino acid adenylation domain-containing protein [Gemmatimonadota bacterium]
ALTETGDALGGVLSYRAELFDAATVERMAGHLSRVLEAMAADAEQRVSRIALAAGEERARLLAWSGAPARVPSETMQALFVAQAARTPAATAVTAADAALTYAGLDAESNRLAHHLRALGAGAGSRVGVAMERSAAMVVSLLAIVKAGAAYVPLDPSYPAERLAFMLGDADVSVLLTAGAPGDAFAAFAGPVVSLAGDADAIAARPADALQVNAHPESLAYVVYTSGSTGRPKGIGIPQRGVVRLVRETDYVQLQADDRVAQASNASFDALTFELWGALLNGATLVVLDRDTTLSPTALADAFASHGITTAFLTTALFNAVAREAPRGFAGLRHLLFGGELVDPAAVRAVLETGAPGRLLHVYGPTESTTYATWQLVPSVAPDAATVPIGGPLANTTIYVLDAAMAPVPAGVPGELFVGGAGLAWGYLGRPALTAETFVPSPFEAGGRLYRTGDRVRWTPRGEIEFVGRVDFQVKIRGFRIEPGEVESAIRAHPDVSDAIVVVRDDPAGRRLVAYAAAEGALTAGELKAYLKSRLPEYMVPSAIVVMEALPLNPNGKVDRAALPEPELWTDERDSIAPRTQAEELLAGIYAEVLGAARVGATDNFFALGGHSLLATRLISRIRQAFAIELPLRALFEAPAVEALAARIDALAREGAGVQAPPLVTVERGGPLPLSFAQQRLWFIDQLEPASAAYNMPFALRLRGALHVAALDASITALVARHETLRTRFAAAAGEATQVIDPPAPATIARIDISHLDPEVREVELHALAADEAALPFDLATGPLFRCTLVTLGDDEHAVLFTLHHIVSDGWSMGVLISEVSELYGAARDGRAPRLAELPVQYADFAAWQRSWLSGDVLDAQLGWWRERLAGASPVIDLPTDGPRTTAGGSHGGTLALSISEETTRGLRSLGRREGTTLFMTLLAAWQLLLSKYAGQDDVSVGSPVAGRTRLETEGLIGFFVNTLVVRSDLAGGPTGAELVARVRERVLEAHAHQ